MRKLASVRRISKLTPIPKADKIETATVDGWEVVVQKGLHNVGDLVCYFEIDSWVPNKIAPFLSKDKEPREYKGVKGEKLRTVKLKGQLSQGLIIPIRELPFESDELRFDGVKEGDDLTEILGVLKWEEDDPIPGKKTTGTFPTWLFPKTAADRVQNVFHKIPDDEYEVTLKLDGSSASFYFDNGEVRAFSRNQEVQVYYPLTTLEKIKRFFGLKVSRKSYDNPWSVIASQIHKRVVSGLGYKANGLVFQGEVMGPKIQGNRENFKGVKFFVFNIFDTKTQKYLTPKERYYVTGKAELEHIPVIFHKLQKPVSVAECLELANRPSINNPVAEGLVFKSHSDPAVQFKAISNKFLLGDKG